MGETNYIVIVGCGRLGKLLAEQLSTNDNHIVVVDNDERAFEQLPPSFGGFKVLGDATEMNTLHRAEITKAHVVFAVTRLDNVNLMVAQVAREIYEVPDVVARVFDPRRETLYAEFSIKTICPTKLSASAFLDKAALLGGE